MVGPVGISNYLRSLSLVIDKRSILIFAFMNSVIRADKSTLKVAACNPGLEPYVMNVNGTLQGYDVGWHFHFTRIA